MDNIAGDESTAQGTNGAAIDSAANAVPGELLREMGFSDKRVSKVG
jgi:hypothetical protein